MSARDGAAELTGRGTGTGREGANGRLAKDEGRRAKGEGRTAVVAMWDERVREGERARNVTFYRSNFG